jgi:predicted PurR-regulated permease PerM
MVAADSSGRSILRTLLMGATAVLVLFAMHVGAYLVNLIVLSILVALLLTPVQSRLRARGMRSSLVLLVCLGLYVVVLGVAAVIVVIGLIDFANNVEGYRVALTTQIQRVFGPTFAEAFPETVANLFEALIASFADAALLIGYSVIVVAYLLLEAPNGERRVLWAANGRIEILDRARAAADRLRGYIVARTVLGLVAAILDFIVLIFLGVPSALLWAVLSFLFSFVPNIGFILALVPPTIVAFAVNGLGSAITVVVAYCVINVLIDYILQPRYIGATVDLSPLVVTLAIVFWGIVLGPAGALLAIPMTIAFVAIADYFEDSRPYARLLMEDVGLAETAGPAGTAGPAQPVGLAETDA